MALTHTINRLENARTRADRFIDSKLKEIAEEVVLAEARSLARQAGLSQYAQDTMHVRRAGRMKVELVWEYYGREGQPLHEFLENGFRRHVIEPKGRDAGGADMLSWRDAGNNRVFARRVQHPGFKGYHIMRDAWDNTKRQLRRRVSEEVSHYMRTESL